jgi:hypothetical protein
MKEFLSPRQMQNYLKEPCHVTHSKLQRADSSHYRSICPDCVKGVLLVGRDPKTFELLAEDNCILCARRFIYTDIEELRALEKGALNENPKS